MPIWYQNRDRESSDIVEIGYLPPTDFRPQYADMDEWGCRWDRLDSTLGQPKSHPLAEGGEGLARYFFPDPNRPERFTQHKKTLSENSGRFVIADLGITGFNIATFLRGFENALTNLYEEPEQFFSMLDHIMAFESGIVEEYGRRGDV